MKTISSHKKHTAMLVIAPLLLSLWGSCQAADGDTVAEQAIAAGAGATETNKINEKAKQEALQEERGRAKKKMDEDPTPDNELAYYQASIAYLEEVIKHRKEASGTLPLTDAEKRLNDIHTTNNERTIMEYKKQVEITMLKQSGGSQEKLAAAQQQLEALQQATTKVMSEKWAQDRELSATEFDQNQQEKKEASAKAGLPTRPTMQAKMEGFKKALEMTKRFIIDDQEQGVTVYSLAGEVYVRIFKDNGSEENILYNKARDRKIVKEGGAKGIEILPQAEWKPVR